MDIMSFHYNFINVFSLKLVISVLINVYIYLQHEKTFGAETHG